MFWQLLSIAAAQEASALQPALLKRSQISSTQPEDVMIVNTLDGCLHGIKKSNGKLLWSEKLQDSSMIKVTDGAVGSANSDSTSLSSNVQKVIFIPEPAGNGDLYYVEPGQKMKKFDVSLKEMVEKNLGVMDSRHMFTGRKDTEILAIDPLHGKILGRFGQSGPSDCKESTKNAIFVGRTEYTLNIWDRESDKLLWNISYVEFNTAGTSLAPSKHGSSIQADVNGKFSMKQHDKGIVM
jgi:serine/threonine-protein kinase/endoribonuclease IRE1